jgi:hypothetical protein
MPSCTDEDVRAYADRRRKRKSPLLAAGLALIV